MMTHSWILVKTLIKSSLDNYVLPGTLTGSEILWLYMIEWKRTMAGYTIASLSLLCSEFELSRLEKVLFSQRAEK